MLSKKEIKAKWDKERQKEKENPEATVKKFEEMIDEALLTRYNGREVYVNLGYSVPGWVEQELLEKYRAGGWKVDFLHREQLIIDIHD